MLKSFLKFFGINHNNSDKIKVGLTSLLKSKHQFTQFDIFTDEQMLISVFKQKDWNDMEKYFPFSLKKNGFLIQIYLNELSLSNRSKLEESVYSKKLTQVKLPRETCYFIPIQGEVEDIVLFISELVLSIFELSKKDKVYFHTKAYT